MYGITLQEAKRVKLEHLGEIPYTSWSSKFLFEARLKLCTVLSCVHCSTMKPGLRARSNAGFRARGGKVGRIRRPLTRKERRKQERTARKQRTAMFHSKNKNSTDEYSTRNGRQNTRKIKKKLQKSDLGISRTAQSANTSKIKDHRASKSAAMIREDKKIARVSQSAAMLREDKEIARLEKLLKMKKRKKLPGSFKDEGLDCIPLHPTMPLLILTICVVVSILILLQLTV